MTDNARYTTRYFAGIIVLVHIVYFLLACVYTRIYMGDSFEYIWEAINIKEQFYFYSGNPALPFKAEYLTQRQPLYPLLLSLVYLFKVNNWVVIVLQNALSIFNILYCRKLFCSLSCNQNIDKWLLLFTIAYPAQFINANTIAPDILLQTFTLLYFGYGIAYWKSEKSKHLLLMSVALVCGLMVKPVLYPFALLHIIIAGYALYAKKAVKLKNVAWLMLPLICVLSYNYTNKQRTGKFHFSSNQAFNAIYYYYPFIAAKYGGDSANNYLTTERLKIASIVKYADQYDYANSKGVTLLKDNFGSYMLFHLKHTFRILIEPGKAEIDLFTGHLTYGRLFNKNEKGFFKTVQTEGIAGLSGYLARNPSLFWVAIVFLLNCFRLAGLYFFFRNNTVPRAIILFAAGLIIYFALAAGPIANTRYFLPVSLISIGCAAIGWTTRNQMRQ